MKVVKREGGFAVRKVRLAIMQFGYMDVAESDCDENDGFFWSNPGCIRAYCIFATKEAAEVGMQNRRNYLLKNGNIFTKFMIGKLNK